ncbi:MAG: S8 family serine peptidase, partial [Methanomassiliicoccales archaeon]
MGITVITTQKKLSNKRLSLLVVALLAMSMFSFTQAIAESGIPNDTTDMDMLPPEEKPWWEDWERDQNKDKIDDALQYHLATSKPSSDELIPVIIDYDHFPDSVDEEKLNNYGWDVQYVCKYIESIVVQVPVAEIENIASRNEIVMVQYAPDLQFTLSSALPSIGVIEVWQNLGYDGEGVTIAILDTGIDDEHQGLDDLDDDPATDDPNVIAFYDVLNHPGQDDGTYEPYDENNGHGTHCAGTAAGTGAPNYNHIGVAPKATLVGVRIGTGDGIPQGKAMAGVEWVIANKDKFGIDIMSCSWGYVIGGPNGHNGQSDISRLMDEAVEAGIVVFVAAGNTAINLQVLAPGDAEKVIT